MIFLCVKFGVRAARGGMGIHHHAPPTRLSFNSCMWEELMKAEPSWPSTDHIQSLKALDGEYNKKGGGIGWEQLAAPFEDYLLGC